MLDPIPILIASDESRRLSRSARPEAPTAQDEPRRARGWAPRAAATLLRGLADRLDGGRLAGVSAARPAAGAR